MQELFDAHVASSDSDCDFAVVDFDADLLRAETVDAWLKSDEHHLETCLVVEVVQEIGKCLINIISLDRLVHSTETLKLSYARLE